MELSSEITSHIENRISLLNDGDMTPTGDDSNSIVFHKKENAIYTALYLVEKMSLKNCHLRIGISSTEIGGTLYEDVGRKTVRYGKPFEIASRISNHCKENGLVEPMEYSQIFVTPDIEEIFMKSYDSKIHTICRFESVKLRGPALPETDIICMSINPQPEDNSTPKNASLGDFFAN